MARLDPVTAFVRDALVAGRSRADIRSALVRAGWLEREINRGLGAFDEQDFLPPVPRPQLQPTAREMFLYLVQFTALAITASSLVNLVHAILDLRMPDPADMGDLLAYRLAGIRWTIATLLTSTPVFVGISVHLGRQVSRDPSLRRSPVRKWLTYATLFVAGLVFLGDATYAIYSFLQGELTLRFILKALTVAIVSGGIFAFYLSGLEDGTDE